MMPNILHRAAGLAAYPPSRCGSSQPQLKGGPCGFLNHMRSHLPMNMEPEPVMSGSSLGLGKPLPFWVPSFVSQGSTRPQGNLATPMTHPSQRPPPRLGAQALRPKRQGKPRVWGGGVLGGGLGGRHGVTAVGVGVPDATSVNLGMRRNTGNCSPILSGFPFRYQNQRGYILKIRRTGPWQQPQVPFWGSPRFPEVRGSFQNGQVASLGLQTPLDSKPAPRCWVGDPNARRIFCYSSGCSLILGRLQPPQCRFGPTLRTSTWFHDTVAASVHYLLTYGLALVSLLRTHDSCL